MNFATVQTKESPVGTLENSDFEGIAAMLCHATVSESKEGPGWIPGHIEPGPRKGERVTHWDTLAIDIEGPAERLPDGTKRLIGPKAPQLSEVAAELDLRGLAGVLHTTHTHEEPTADGDTLGPRYRVVLNPSRPILPSEIKPLGLAVVAMLGLSACTDTKCLEPARLFYLPRCPAERLHLAQSVVLDGKTLDVDRVLSQAKRSAAPSPRKHDPAGASVIEAFNAQADMGHLLEQQGYASKGRNRWVWPGSTSGLAGVVLMTDTGRVYSHHPGDPLAGEHSHDAFSLWCTLAHGGNFAAAVKDAARAMGMAHTQAEPVDFSGLVIDNDTGEVHTTHPLALFVDIGDKPRPPRWVIPGFIGHGVVTIAGAHGVGKTTAMLPLAMVAAGLHGSLDALAPRHWRHVVYIVEDVEQARRILAGIVGWGGLPFTIEQVKERVHIVEARRLDPLVVAQVGKTYREQFTRTVEGVEVLPLVVVDTKAAVLELENENDNSEASRAMAALKQGFDGLPTWLIGHLAKQNIGRADVAGLSLRGGSAFEADANQVLFLVKEADDTRWLVRGKTRFEAKWAELAISAATAETLAPDEFGNIESVTLRWGIPHPPTANRKALAEQAKADTQQAELAELRDEIRAAVQEAWSLGHPINREAVKAKVKRRATEVVSTIESLLAEGWLYEVAVPAKERAHPRRSAFLVNLTTEQHEAFRADGLLPDELVAIPQSWRKPPISSIPDENSGAIESEAL